MNCTELDVALEDAHALVLESDGGFFVATGALLVTSLLLLAMGERLVRPLGAVLAGAAAAVAGFVFTRSLDACPARLAIAGTASVLAAVVALCLFKTGLFVLGAAGFGAVGHFVYEALPLENVKPPFVLLGRSGYYYLAVGATALVGAIASQFQRTHFVRIASSLVGGGGLAFGTHLIADRAGHPVPALLLLVLLLVSTVAGVGTQYHCAARSRSSRRARVRQTTSEARYA